MDALPLSEYDYELPARLIATEPCVPRDASRLLVVPAAGPVAHARMQALPGLLRRGDVLLVNTTQVIRARLTVWRQSGARIECLLVRPVGGAVAEARAWQVLARNAQSVRPGEQLVTAAGVPLVLEPAGADDDGLRQLASEHEPLLAVSEREGEVPLPPYIARLRPPRARDAADYQALFARDAGAVAAPTASLHFTPALVAAAVARGATVHELCLHVGAGTFLPIRPEHAHDVRTHRMHAEAYCIPQATVAAVAAARAEGRRVVAIGTTALRAIETWAATGQAAGDSQLFVYPGVPLRVVDALLTNFHQPRSTLLLLVAALAGRERMLGAYQEALAHNYRFLSFGDAMWLERPSAAGARPPLSYQMGRKTRSFTAGM